MEPDGSDNVTPDLHPNRTALLVFSDLAGLYGGGGFDPGQRTQRRKDTATGRKLGFYATRVVCMPAVTLRVLADEVLAQSKSVVLESGGEQSESLISASRSSRAAPVRSGLAIEEL